MPTAAYNAWLADPTRERIVLVEIQPADHLRSFVTEAVAILPSLVGQTPFVAMTAFGSTFSSSLSTAAGNNTCLVVRLGGISTTLTGVTAVINGTDYAMTKVDGALSGSTRSEVWYLLNPAVGSVSIKMAGSGLTAISFTTAFWKNVNQSTPFGTATKSTSLSNPSSVVVTSNSTSVVIDMLYIAPAVTATAGGSQTQDYNTLDGPINRLATSRQNGASSVTMTWSLSGTPGSSLAHIGIGLQGNYDLHKVAWPKQVLPAVVTGGMYRRLDSIRDTTTGTLSNAGTKSACATTAGSYFYDSISELIYVHPANDVSPNTLDFVGAWFTLFFSTSEPEFTDGSPIYEPRLTGSLPKISGEKPDEMFGASIWGDGVIEIANGDRIFDQLSRSWIWENKLATIKVGGPSMALTDFVTIRTLRIMSFNVDDYTAKVAVQDMTNILNRTMPPHSVAGIKDSLAQIGYFIGNNQEILSLAAPVLMGSMNDVPMVFLYDSGGTAAYLVRDVVVDNELPYFPVYVVTALYAIDTNTGVRTTLSTAGDFNGVISTGVYELVANYAYRESQGYELRCDVLHVDNVFPHHDRIGSFAYLLLRMCGEIDANIDTAAFSAMDDAVPYQMAIYVGEDTPASEILRNLEQSGLAQTYIGSNGKWTIRALDPAAAIVASLVSQDFTTWKAQIDNQSVLSEVRVRYSNNPSTKGFLEVSRSDTAIRVGRESSDKHSIPTYIVNQADAREICDRYAFIKQRTHSLIDSDLRALDLIGVIPGDLVGVTRDRAPTVAGSYTNSTILIRAITLNLGPLLRVSVTLDDLGEVLNSIGVYSDDTGADWSTATDDQKRTLGFYSNDDGYIDATDPTTRFRKVYW